MLGNIISQLYRIADLLKTKKLVDIDSNTDSDSSEDKPKELTLEDIYQYYKSQLKVLKSDDILDGIVQPFPETFDDIELVATEYVDESGIYKCDFMGGDVLFSYITDTDDRYYVCYLPHKSPAA